MASNGVVVNSVCNTNNSQSGCALWMLRGGETAPYMQCWCTLRMGGNQAQRKVINLAATCEALPEATPGHAIGPKSSGLRAIYAPCEERWAASCKCSSSTIIRQSSISLMLMFYCGACLQATHIIETSSVIANRAQVSCSQGP